MSRISIVLLIVLLTSGVARAQGARAATLADSLKASQRAYDHLFEGIPLTLQQRSSAMKVIRATFVAKLTLPLSPGCKGVQQLISLEDQRNSVLKAMLANPEDQARFAQRAADRRPKGVCS